MILSLLFLPVILAWHCQSQPHTSGEAEYVYIVLVQRTSSEKDSLNANDGGLAAEVRPGNDELKLAKIACNQPDKLSNTHPCLKRAVISWQKGLTSFYSDGKLEIAQGLFAELEILDRDVPLLDPDLEVLPLQALYPCPKVAGEDPCSEALQHIVPLWPVWNFRLLSCLAPTEHTGPKDE